MKFDFSKAFNTFLNEITENNFHVKDIEYPETLDDKDNCFITDFLDIEFHIEECPDWRFGVWMYISDKYNEKSIPSFVSGTFFGQYEETIDKFRPSCSAYQTKIEIANEKDCSDFFDYLIDILNFIKNEPMLAFYRDYTGCDYNLKIVSREEATEEYKQYKARKKLTDDFRAEADKAILDFVITNILPNYPDSEIYDQGDDWSPRYDIIAPYEKNKDLFELEAPGDYALDEEDIKALRQEANKWEEKAKEINMYYYSPIDPFIMFIENVHKYKEDEKAII